MWFLLCKSRKMSKLIFGVLLLLVATSTLAAEEILSLEGGVAWSFRHRALSGMVGVKSRDFANGWLCAKVFAIPEFDEFGLGLEVNLLNKIKAQEEVQSFFNVIEITLGIWGGGAINDPIEKSQGDGGFCGCIVRIPIGRRRE